MLGIVAWVVLFADCEAGAAGKGKLQGVLVDEAGEVVAGAEVHLLGPDRIGHFTETVTTDGSGAFSFGSVTAGDHVLAYGPLLEQGRWVEVEVGETSEVEFELEDRGVGGLSGTVSVDGECGW
ncbi:carboxypeptidase-like regulatory domain-containing protein [Anaerohalosphaera lusitana]|nr:carboxypeptidase-like regulatory domain-containing protein [Anaerohalosphaera lusitana]